MMKTPAILLSAILVVGCGKSTQETNEALASGVRSQIIRVNASKSLDATALDYIKQCKASGDFRTEARIVPLLTQAVQVKAITPEQAEVHYQEMLAKGGPNAPYWQTVIGHLKEREKIQ